MERFVKFVLFLLRLTIISVKKVTFGGISGLNEGKIDPKNAENYSYLFSVKMQKLQKYLEYIYL